MKNWADIAPEPIDIVGASALLGVSVGTMRDLVRRFPECCERAGASMNGKLLFYPEHIVALREARKCLRSEHSAPDNTRFTAESKAIGYENAFHRVVSARSKNKRQS